MKKIILFTLLLVNLNLYSQNTNIITINDFGNKWFSNHNFFIQNTLEMGMSGSKDILSENMLFSYRFLSKNRHAFSIRNYHIGYAPGIFTNNFTYFNFGVLAGFEYMFKIFSNTEGVFFYTDIGGCQNGIAVNAGFGLGSRVKDGIDINFTYLQNVGFFSRLDFNFLIVKYLILHGKFGIDLKYSDNVIDIFTFFTGAYIGFSINNYFRLELGGGLTINDYAKYSGFGGIIISTSFPN
jgi:hypothetical protein